MTSMNSQDNAVQELVLAKQWKQALNLCEKRIKKAPGNDYHLLAKLRVLLQWPDDIRNKQGLKDLEDLLERKPPMTDGEALLFLDALIQGFGIVGKLTPKQVQVWQRAAASRPQDEELLAVWYRSKFLKEDYRGAQQASMFWMKNFPAERKPFFLYILNTHLVSQETTDEKEKALMESLAHRNLSKAMASASEPQGEASGSNRQIEHFEDRCLLLRVYRAQGRYEEALEMLDDTALGVTTMVGQYRWELLNQYMDLLEMQGSWTQVATVCHKILVSSYEPEKFDHQYAFGEPGNDWNIWERLVRANFKEKRLKDSSLTRDLIQSFCGPLRREYDRNPRLAYLCFCSSEAFENSEAQNALLKALTNHFVDFSVKTVCFQDLKPWLNYLDLKRRTQLVTNAAQHSHSLRPQPGAPESSMIFWITSEINLLKLEYFLVVSQDWNSHRADLLAAMVSNSIRLYKESLRFGFELPASDRRPGDDAALIAAMCLIRLFKLGKRHALLQCIFVLEQTLLYSNHNYDALLILVRLYMFLGAGSLAVDRYNRLSIKNIQHATISWVLYTRLSTIHPYFATQAAGGKRKSTFVPYEEMLNAYDWHRTAGELCQQAVQTMQNGSQWNLSLDALETHDAVQHGFARCMFLVETKRIERLSPAFRAAMKQDHPIPRCTRDNRDRDAFPNFEGGELTFEQHLPMVGTSRDPDDVWLHHELSLALLWENIHYGYSELNAAQIEAMSQSSGWNQDSLTPAESATAGVVRILTELYRLYAREDQFEKRATQQFIVQFMENLQIWLTISSDAIQSSTEAGMFSSLLLRSNLNVPLWNLYHESFSHIEQCKFILATLEYVVGRNKKQPIIDHETLVDRVKILQKQCLNLSTLVRTSATTIRDNLRKHETLHKLHEVVKGDSSESRDEAMMNEELKSLSNRSKILNVCEELRESWVDGLEDVIHTQTTSA